MTNAEREAVKRALAAFRDAHAGLAALVLASDNKAVRDAAWRAIDGMERAQYELAAITLPPPRDMSAPTSQSSSSAS